MIIVTGGAGLIGSAIIWKLNQNGIDDIVVADELKNDQRWKNLVSLKFSDYINKSHLVCFEQFIKNADVVIHMGACSSTTEQNADYLMDNNFTYSKRILHNCQKYNKRLIYASSCATYGNGQFGYSDKQPIDKLKPLNMYGYSKQIFDLYVEKHYGFKNTVGCKFSNVFGPNQLHKGNMMSMISKSYFQIKENNCIQLFKSYNDNYKDGQQLRDFVYIKDVADMVFYLLDNKIEGLFNIGSGETHSWNQLATNVFKDLNKEPNIKYIDMPQNIKQHYQYYTQAKIDKLRQFGYNKKLTSFKDAISDTIKYLNNNMRLGEQNELYRNQFE